MRFLIFAIFSCSGAAIFQKHQNETLWAKLEHYKNVTGISNGEVAKIWRKSTAEQGVFFIFIRNKHFLKARNPTVCLSSAHPYRNHCHQEQ